MTSASILLHPGRERSLLRGHPWIFSGAISKVTGEPHPGATVVVRAADGTTLGRAAFSPASQIRARMWTFNGDEQVDAAMIAARIHSAWTARASLFVSPDNAARIVFSEADGVPGLIADRYGEVVVCQLTTVGAEMWRNEIGEALLALPGVTSVFERSDADVREREGLGPRVGLLAGAPPPDQVVIRESGWRFAVDITEGHKTGFYLDQRDARGKVAELANGRRVLNVFAYTGAFSVIAAACGAASVTTVDSSGPALAMALRNAALNDVAIDNTGSGDAQSSDNLSELVEADAFTYLRGLRDRARQYDLIILDPPKLANTEQQVTKASRAYKDLNLLALKLLAPGGTLLTFSCSGAMSMELFQKVVAGAALDSRRDAAIVGRLHQPSDHPVPLAFPEAEYLKGLIVRAG